AVRLDPQRQADQSWRVRGEEHADDDHGPDGGLHGPGHYLGHGDELAGRPVAARVRLERAAAGAAGGPAGCDAVRVIREESLLIFLDREADDDRAVAPGQVHRAALIHPEGLASEMGGRDAPALGYARPQQ